MSAVKSLKFAPFYFLSLLPFWMIFGISNFAYFLLFVIFKYRKEVVYRNLKKSFPNESDKKINLKAKRFYKHFCEIFIESLKLLTISNSEIKKRYSFKNLDLLEDLYAQNKSIILYGAHIGNWEWMASLQLQTDYQMYSFYQKQSNNYFNDFMIHIRERFGNICIESKSGFKVLLRNAREKKRTITYVIGDQSPMSNSSMYWTTFLNQETAFLVGADRMAKKCNQELIYPNVIQTKKGFYEIDFKIIPTNSEVEPVKIYAEFLEENIKSQPELWLWSHRRWKRKK